MQPQSKTWDFNQYSVTEMLQKYGSYSILAKPHFPLPLHIFPVSKTGSQLTLPPAIPSFPAKTAAIFTAHLAFNAVRALLTFFKIWSHYISVRKLAAIFHL